jgi:hypothetical protein
MELIDLVKNRQSAGAEFNYGILTADRYVSNLSDCVGTDLCYRYGCRGNVSFDDAVKRARRTLTYSNPDLIPVDVYHHLDELGDIELPKNTLMVFKHILTTPRRDRDGDILRTKGAQPDPNMLLLWQHVHTLPIGKALGVVEHTADRLVMLSAVIDMNELSHDAAVMIENKMGRFSHGFKALEFEKIKQGKADQAKPTGGGFDVKRFEIMEESLVSVPANIDAETIDVMLPLIEADKLSSSIMKSFGKTLRSKLPVQSTGVDLEDQDVDETDEKGSGGGCGCGGTGGKCDCKKPPKSAPKETSESDDKEQPGKTDSDDKGLMCPKCEDAYLKDGTCPKCGYKAKAEDKDEDEPEEKAQTPSEAPEDSETDSEKESDKCPKCKIEIGKGGTCPDCGHRSSKETEALSLETLQNLLSKAALEELGEGEDADSYPHLEATFEKSAVFSVGSKHYRYDWDCNPQGCKLTNKVEVSRDIEFRPMAEEPVKGLQDVLILTKAGRVLSKTNYELVKEIHDDLNELHGHCSTRSGKALCSKCSSTAKTILESASKGASVEETKASKSPDPETEAQALATKFLSIASEAQIAKMGTIIETLGGIRKQRELTENCLKMIGPKS